MTEMIERVAAAIEAAQCLGREGPFGLYDYSDYKTATPHRVRDFRDPLSEDYGKAVFAFADREQARVEYERLTKQHIARAAIEAMREPTGEQTEAGQNKRNARDLFDRNDAYHVWRAMIDAALDEPKT